MLLHTDSFTHRCFYTQNSSHTNAFTHRHPYAQTLLHTNTCTLYTQAQLHTDALHEGSHIHTLCHTETFYTQTPHTLLHPKREKHAIRWDDLALSIMLIMVVTWRRQHGFNSTVLNMLDLAVLGLAACHCRKPQIDVELTSRSESTVITSMKAGTWILRPESISQAMDRCLRWHLTYPCSRCLKMSLEIVPC